VEKADQGGREEGLGWFVVPFFNKKRASDSKTPEGRNKKGHDAAIWNALVPGTEKGGGGWKRQGEGGKKGNKKILFNSVILEKGQQSE